MGSNPTATAIYQAKRRPLRDGWSVFCRPVSIPVSFDVLGMYAEILTAVAINDLVGGDAAERYWMEITDQEDLGET